MPMLLRCITLLALALPAAAQATTGSAATTPRPNVVVFFLEGTGAGWSSTSVAMDDRRPEAKAPAAMTPHLQRLADSGMRFSDFYVSAPRCTPARASLLTGMSAAKLGMTYVNEGGAERRGAGRGGRGAEAADAPAAVQKLIPPACRNDLPAETTTVAELVRDAGYRTAHFG